MTHRLFPCKILPLTMGLILFAIVLAPTAGFASEMIESQTVETEDATIPVYRLYVPDQEEHLYTTDEQECRFLQKQGAIYQGICMYGVPISDDSVPVYRLYDPSAGRGDKHLYTTERSEYDRLAQDGWAQEGAAWYLPAVSEYPVYLVRSPMASSVFTANQSVRDELVSTYDYDDLGQVWYSAGPSDDNTSGEVAHQPSDPSQPPESLEPSTLILPTAPIEMTEGDPWRVVEVSGEGTGAIHATSSNTAVATVSVSGTTIQVNPVGPGTADIHVTKDADDTHTGREDSFTVVVKEKVVQPATRTVYRLYDPKSGAHHYTLDGNERDVLFGKGWDYEGVAWTTPVTSSTPVYRLYYPRTDEHHYTTSLNEYNVLADRHGWTREGIAWYSDDSKTVPVWRLNSPELVSRGVSSHHFTVDGNEHRYLSQHGWDSEDIGFYASAKTDPNAPTGDQVALNSLNGWWVQGGNIGPYGLTYFHIKNGIVYSYNYNEGNNSAEYYETNPVRIYRNEWVNGVWAPGYVVIIGDSATRFVYYDSMRNGFECHWGENLEGYYGGGGFVRTDAPQRLKDFAIQYE